MKKLKNNNKGFTLVELLAVIVILALIMVLVVPSVLTTMNDARKSTFVLYAEKSVNAAKSIYTSYSTFNTTDMNLTYHSSASKLYCISVANLGMDDVGTYGGFIIIDARTSNVTYTVYMTDGTYYTLLGIPSELLDTSAVNGDSKWLSSSYSYPYAASYYSGTTAKTGGVLYTSSTTATIPTSSSYPTLANVLSGFSKTVNGTTATNCGGVTF